MISHRRWRRGRRRGRAICDAKLAADSGAGKNVGSRVHEEEIRAGAATTDWEAGLSQLERAASGLDAHVLLRLGAMIAERRGNVAKAYPMFVSAAEAAEAVGAFEQALARLGAARTAPNEELQAEHRNAADLLLDRMAIIRTGWIGADLT